MVTREQSKQAFQECWQLRSQRRPFINCLLKKLGDAPQVSIWTQDHRGVMPTFRQRARLRAVLDGWAGYINGNYIDNAEIFRISRSQILGGKRLEGRADHREGVQKAYGFIKNPVNGCMKSIAVALESSANSQPYFGSSLWPGWNVDTFFNHLLKWEEDHISGLIRWCISMTARSFDSAEDIVSASCRRLMVEMATNPSSIYGRYQKYGVMSGNLY